MQQKDRASAKHLLQVFCDSPSQARQSLLPELWDLVFLPLLSHLKVWYDHEMASIPDTSSKQRKLRVLKKVYNEILDSGTYQFAVYYKDWLTEGIEAPVLPSISIPSTSIQVPLKGDSVEHSPDIQSTVDSISSQPMVSERLYNAVFVISVVREDMHVLQTLPLNKANELILWKLAQSVFSVLEAKNSDEFSTVVPISHFTGKPIHASCSNLIGTNSYAEAQYANDGCFDRESFFSNIPKDFVCPLTGELFEDPITLETGHTFEQKAIKEWLDRGSITCPISGRSLERLTLPTTNFVLKHVIGRWTAEHYRNLLLIASKVADHSFTHGCKAKDEAIIYILEQLLNCFKAAERLANAKQLISLGGLKFLLCRFELGNLEEKKRVAELLTTCIKAYGECRNYVVENISKSSLLQLLHKQQIKSRSNAVMLLTEFICLKRKTQVKLFFKSLQKEGVMNTMHVLLVYLQTSPPEQRPLVAVLLLHFDLLAKPRKYSIYREEAVDSITIALECSLNDENIREQCCRALLILAGQFSSSGDVLIEGWLLRQAGFCHAGENYQIDEAIQLEEEKAREDWWKNLAASLLGNGKKPFLETIAKCLNSGNSRLMRTCLVTVAWISQALALLTDAEFQLSAFSTFIPCLPKW